jgi:hypothetical protein
MHSDLSARIDKMFRLDRLWAWGFVVVLWCVVGFVLAMVYPLVDDGTVRIVMIVAAALLVAFNTASIAAMVHHYAHDKEFIYGLDIRHLDESRRAAAAAAAAQPAEKGNQRMAT